MSTTRAAEPVSVVDRLHLPAEDGHEAQREDERRAHPLAGPPEVGPRDAELVDTLAAEQLARRQLVLHPLEGVDPGAGVAARPHEGDGDEGSPDREDDEDAQDDEPPSGASGAARLLDRHSVES